MGDNSTSTYLITTDPFFTLNTQINDVKTKVADSIFENYKLQVAQANDINNRAMQVALHDVSALSDLKQASSNGTLQAMLAAARTDSAIGATSMSTQREVMHQGERDRALANALNTQNLNTALINTNTVLIGVGGQYAGLGLAYGGAVAAVSAVQSANSLSAVNALNSAIAGNGIVNTGSMTTSTQTSTPVSIG